MRTLRRRIGGNVLTIFNRHTKECGQKSRRYRRCGCPVWIEGTLGGEKVKRRSLDLTSYEAAENLVREWTRVGRVGGVAIEPKLIEETVKLFIADAESRNLADESLRLYRRFIGRQLPAWTASKGFRYVKELTFERLIEFRSSWKFKAVTAAKRLELLKAFFRFSVSAGWIEKDPAEGLRNRIRKDVFRSRMQR